MSNETTNQPTNQPTNQLNKYVIDSPIQAYTGQSQSSKKTVLI